MVHLCGAASGRDCDHSIKVGLIDDIDTHAHRWSEGTAARRCVRVEAAAGARVQEQSLGPGACSTSTFILFALTSDVCTSAAARRCHRINKQ